MAKPQGDKPRTEIWAAMRKAAEVKYIK